MLIKVKTVRVFKLTLFIKFYFKSTRTAKKEILLKLSI